MTHAAQEKDQANNLVTKLLGVQMRCRDRGQTPERWLLDQNYKAAVSAALNVLAPAGHKREQSYEVLFGLPVEWIPPPMGVKGECQIRDAMGYALACFSLRDIFEPAEDFPNLRALSVKPEPLQQALKRVLPTLPPPDVQKLLRLALGAMDSGPPSDGKVINREMDTFNAAMTPEAAIWLIGRCLGKSE